MVKVDSAEMEVDKYGQQLYNILLKDRTTERNIIWATSDYSDYGESFQAQAEIKLISKKLPNVITPRIRKNKQKQCDRTREKAEVFTPSWICNKQNNLIDEQWFGRANVFNSPYKHKWKTNPDTVLFSKEKGKDWSSYVDARRMEITCGEAPYLVSRYDTVTGKFIDIIDRIGLLDRKLRVINENADNEKDWFFWVMRAYQSVYGYEYQGDSLLLARLNLIYTFIDNIQYKFNRMPAVDELKKIATIISWNLWQMDGTTYSVPNCDVVQRIYQLSFFEEEVIEEIFTDAKQLCKIKDWRSKTIIEYKSLVKEQ